MLHTHWLCELEQQLSLRMEQDKELEDELKEKLERQELDMLELLLDSSLEHLLLEELMDGGETHEIGLLLLLLDNELTNEESEDEELDRLFLLDDLLELLDDLNSCDEDFEDILDDCELH